jgi:DNA polymerase/3'-5' exonuclease PolX
MLVTYPEAMTEKAASEFFRSFVSELTRRGYILDKLVAGPKKWMGYVRIGEGIPRRLDLLLTPPSQYGYAILYFTGSDKFNIGFRKWCLAHGYTLNEHEMKPTGDKPMPPALKTEEAIFEFVGLKYVLPTERVDATQIVPS